MAHFFIKKVAHYRTPKKFYVLKNEDKAKGDDDKSVILKNKPERKVTGRKNKDVMDTKEKVEMVANILDNEVAPKVKKIKQDKGLIERTESSKTIITEDNRELLIG